MTPILFTRFALPTSSSECRIEILRNDVSPGKEACEFAGHLEVGSAVRVIRTYSHGRWMKIHLTHQTGGEFAIYLDRSGGREKYAQLFDMVFSKTAVDVAGSVCDAKLKQDVIATVGFPSTITRQGPNDNWYYGVSHISIGTPGICGFDAATILFRSGHVKSLSGIV